MNYLKLQRLSHFSYRVYHIFDDEMTATDETNVNYQNYAHVYDESIEKIQLWSDLGFDENIIYRQVQFMENPTSEKSSGIDDINISITNGEYDLVISTNLDFDNFPMGLFAPKKQTANEIGNCPTFLNIVHENYLSISLSKIFKKIGGDQSAGLVHLMDDYLVYLSESGKKIQIFNTYTIDESIRSFLKTKANSDVTEVFQLFAPFLLTMHKISCDCNRELVQKFYDHNDSVRRNYLVEQRTILENLHETSADVNKIHEQ